MCVDADATPQLLAARGYPHTGLVDNDPSTPADYLGAIMARIHLRPADP